MINTEGFPSYTRSYQGYPLLTHRYKGGPFEFLLNLIIFLILVLIRVGVKQYNKMAPILMLLLVVTIPLQGCISDTGDDEFLFVITNTSDDCGLIMQIESDTGGVGPFQKGWTFDFDQTNETPEYQNDEVFTTGVQSCDGWITEIFTELCVGGCPPEGSWYTQSLNNSTDPIPLHPFIEVYNKSWVEVGTIVTFHIRENLGVAHGTDPYELRCTVIITQEHLESGTAECR